MYEIGLTYALLLLIFDSNSTIENVHSEVEEICYYYPILLQLLIELSEKFTYNQKIYLDTFRKLKLYFFLFLTVLYKSEDATLRTLLQYEK